MVRYKVVTAETAAALQESGIKVQFTREWYGGKWVTAKFSVKALVGWSSVFGGLPVFRVEVE